MAPALNVGDAVDLIAQVQRAREVIEPEDLLQALCALVYQRQIIQREVRDQLPKRSFAQRRTIRWSWPTQGKDLLNRRESLQIEVSGFGTLALRFVLGRDRKFGGQAPICACAPH